MPTASEDGHEYLCFITLVTLKARRQPGTAAHLVTWFPIYPALEGKHQLTASNLTERVVSHHPLPLCVCPHGHTDATVPCHPSPGHWDVEKGGKSNGETRKEPKFTAFFPHTLSILVPSEVLEEILKGLLGKKAAVRVVCHLPCKSPRTHYEQNMNICGVTENQRCWESRENRAKDRKHKVHPHILLCIDTTSILNFDYFLHF